MEVTLNEISWVWKENKRIYTIIDLQKTFIVTKNTWIQFMDTVIYRFDDYIHLLSG